jgi:S1-C subfamily serine protease
VPEWVLVSASLVKLPEIEYKPKRIFLPALKVRPRFPLDAATVAKWYEGLVGEIFAERRGGGRVISTGAVISPDGLILTCAHGLSGEDLKVKFRSGSWAGTYAAEIIFINDDSDVALIQAKGLKTSRWIEIRLDGNIEKGEEIVAIGNPSLPDGSLSIEAISKGIVSNSESEFYRIPRLVADITVASGSSGGPLISFIDGKLIGVVVAVAAAELARDPAQRSASGTLCLAAPSIRLREWLGLESKGE